MRQNWRRGAGPRSAYANCFLLLLLLLSISCWPLSWPVPHLPSFLANSTTSALKPVRSTASTCGFEEGKVPAVVHGLFKAAGGCQLAEELGGYFGRADVGAGDGG